MFEAALSSIPIDSIPTMFASVQLSYIINSIVLLTFVFSIRFFLIRSVKRRSIIISKEQRQWINHIRAASFVLVLIGLAFIWAPHLHTFAISIAAFAVALVIATKEMILCLMGALVRVTTQPFHIGDWITIDGVTGEVIEINAFSTNIQEVYIKNNSFHFTGRTIQIPHSKFFTSNIENSNFNKEFIYTDFTIPIQIGDFSVHELLDALVLISDRYYAPFREQSFAYRRKVENKAFIDIPDPEPLILTMKPDAYTVSFKVRAFVPTREAELYSHRVIRDFMDRMQDIRNGSSTTPKRKKREN